VDSFSGVKKWKRSGSNLERVKKTFSYYGEEYEKLFEKIHWVDGDIMDRESVDRALEGVEYLFHCAAMVSFSPRDRRQMVENNITGTENIVNACLEKGIVKLCYVSSTAAIGYSQDTEEANETMNWDYSKRRSAYSVSKYRSEMEVWRGIAEGLNAVIVNPSIVIGPGDWERSSARIFDTVWKGLNFYTYGVTGYVDVRDVVSSMITLMHSDVTGERYLLTSENLSFREIFSMVAESLGKKPPKIYAHPVFTGIAWRLDWFISKILFREPTVTHESAKSAHNRALFSNKKIREQTRIAFKPVKESVADTARIFLEEHSKQ